MSEKDTAPTLAQPATKMDFTAESVPVVTGKDIMTGKDVVKHQPAPKKPKFDPSYNTTDRKGYVATRASTGSLNGRKFDFKVGDAVNLNEDEFGLFKDYVEVPK